MSASPVFIVGVGRTPFRRHDVGSAKLAQAAVTACIADAGASIRDVGAVFYATTAHGAIEHQHMIPGQVALRPIGVSGAPLFNVENACASGASAIHLGYQSICSGAADVVLAVGADKLNSGDRKVSKSFFEAGTDVRTTHATLSNLWAEADPAADVDSSEDRSIFMDIYAAFARHYMRQHRFTQRHLAMVASKNRFHGALNGNAHRQQRISVDEVLQETEICWPLTRSMCAPISDGAAAVLLCHQRVLHRFDRRRACRLRASVIRTGSDRRLADEESHITRLAATNAYEAAAVSPKDLSLVELHDATAVGELIQYECLELCERGAAAALLEAGATNLGGRVPVNASGGLVSNGHPIGATGLSQVHELVLQLRNEAGARQVHGARLGMAENGGGLYGVEEAVASVLILEASAG